MQDLDRTLRYVSAHSYLNGNTQLRLLRDVADASEAPLATGLPKLCEIASSSAKHKQDPLWIHISGSGEDRKHSEDVMHGRLRTSADDKIGAGRTHPAEVHSLLHKAELAFLTSFISTAAAFAVVKFASTCSSRVVSVCVVTALLRAVNKRP